MCKSGIYQITLKKDGRSYIGSAINIETRWRDHQYYAKTDPDRQVITRALAKHGIDNFEWKILEHCDAKILLEREQHWLNIVRPFVDEHNGFNVRKIADSNFGITRSVESRRKQSEKMKGVPKTEEHRKNISKSWHQNRTPEYYAMLSSNVKGDKNPATRPEVREKISKAMTGKMWKHDLSRVQKHIEQRKGKKYSEEAKKNMKLAQQRNKTRSEEAKEKFYLAQRKLYEISRPDGSTFQLYSRELKQFCIENSLTYACLITTAKTNKTYKGGWKATLLE